MTWQTLTVRDAKHPALVHLGQLPDSAVEGLDHRKVPVRKLNAVVFRHDYETWRTLRERGMLAPSPMRHYHWPGPYTPKSHQKETAEFLTLHDRCFCLNGIGTGKTMASIWGMDFLMRHGAVRRVLVIAPLSLCRTVWVRELFKAVPRTRVKFLTGPRKKKQEAAKDTGNQIIIINPESLHLVEKQLTDVDLVIVDEFTKFKTINTQRYKALLRVIKEGRRLWMLSATPAPQSPVDAYGPIRLVQGKCQFTKRDWMNMTMVQVSTFTWVPKKGCEDTIYKHMQPAIRFRKEDCYDLEEVITIPLDISMTKKQTETITNLRDLGATMVDDEEISVVNAAAFFNKAQQVMLGFAYNSDKEPVHIGAQPLYDTIKDLIDSSPQPVLLFAPFKAAVNKLQKDLTKDGFIAKKITSDVGEKERSSIFDSFQSGEIKVIVAVPSTMSHGLTLIESNVVIWAAAPTSFEIYDQAIGRVARMGQTRQVVNYQLSNHKIGWDLYKRLDTREKLQTTLLKMYEG